MIRPLAALVLAAAAGLTLPAGAQGVFVSPPGEPAAAGPLRGQRADVAQELRTFGFPDVDVRRLSSGQVAHIALAVHSGRPRGQIVALIESTLRGGLLQRGIDRVLRQ